MRNIITVLALSLSLTAQAYQPDPAIVEIMMEEIPPRTTSHVTDFECNAHMCVVYTDLGDIVIPLWNGFLRFDLMVVIWND